MNEPPLQGDARRKYHKRIAADCCRCSSSFRDNTTFAFLPRNGEAKKTCFCSAGIAEDKDPCERSNGDWYAAFEGGRSAPYPTSGARAAARIHELCLEGGMGWGLGMSWLDMELYKRDSFEPSIQGGAPASSVEFVQPSFMLRLLGYWNMMEHDGTCTAFALGRPDDAFWGLWACRLSRWTNDAIGDTVSPVLSDETWQIRETQDGDFKHGLLGADSPPEHFSVSVTDPRCEPWISLVLYVLSGNPSLWSAFWSCTNVGLWTCMIQFRNFCRSLKLQ